MSTKQTSQLRESNSTESETLLDEKGKVHESTILEIICLKTNKVIEKVLDRLFVVNPESLKLQKWLLLMYIFCLYSLWSLIARQAFYETCQVKLGFLWLVLDACCDTLYLFDIVIQLRTGYLENGLFVYDSAKMKNHYLASSSFILDVVSVFPLGFVLELFFLKYKHNPMLRFNRFFKAYRAKEFSKKFESVTSQPSAWRIFNLVQFQLLIMHWFACFHHLLLYYDTSPVTKALEGCY